jgi:predicted Fe-Mo cluster-binding NifX family protein
MPERVKIAVISDDGISISQHLGKAPYAVVFAIEGGKVLAREERHKPGHHTFAAHSPELSPGERHGYDAGAEVRHDEIVQAISDCQVVIAGRMGWGIYESLKARNIEPIATGVKEIDKAVGLYLEGELPHVEERLD